VSQLAWKNWWDYWGESSVSSETNVVHLLWYVRERPPERDDAEILIGVYSSEAAA